MDKVRILIVEDEEIIALELASRVKKLGYDVCNTVTNATQAIDEVTRCSPDLILMDILIEGDVNGIELAQKINQIQKTPVIYCTAFNDQGVIALAKRTLPYGYLTKPISGNDLRITLELATYRIKIEQELELAQKLLKKTEKKYQLIAENSTDLIYVYNFQPEPHYEFISPSCLQLTGYTPKDVYENPFAFHEFFAKPDDAERFTNYLYTVPPPSEPFVGLWRRKECRLIWVEQLVTRHYDNNGNLVSFQSTVRDITQRIEFEEKLQHEEERYRRITESITDYLYRIKVENGIATQTIHNEVCFGITGYTLQELNADKNLWLKMIFPDDRRMVLANIQRILNGDDIPYILHRLVRKDEQLIWITNTLIPRLNKSGIIESCDGIIKDFTENIRLHDKLTKIAIEVEDRERNRFSQEIHDGLGPLLATIKLYFHWLHENDDPEKTKLLSEKGLFNTKKAIQTAKEVSRNLSPLYLAKDGLSKSLQVFVNDFDLVTNTKISYTSKITIRLNQLLETTIYRIATELIYNGVRHAKATKIDFIIALNNKSQLIELTCRDNGIGFDVAKKQLESTGMGLSGIQNRTHSLRGQLVIDSHPGKGTNVTVRIPIF